MNQTNQHRPCPPDKPDKPDKPDRPDRPNRPEYQFDDEIELIDYLRVIWKRKYLIVAGTLVCAVAAGVISFSMPKVYSIDMIVRPGILSIQPNGNHTYIDSRENIKTTIETETFNREVLNNVNPDHNNDSIKSLDFKIDIPKNSNELRISCQTPNIELGLKASNRMRELLLKKYSERVAYFQNEYELQISSKKSRVVNYDAERRFAERCIKNFQKRIDELTSEVGLIKKNTNVLIKARDKFLSDNTSDSNILSAVLYTNTIQQNIALENTYREQINEYVTKQEDEELDLEKLNSEERRLSEEIKSLEFKKNNIQNIEILQLPTAGPHPINPKTKLNVMLASVAGLFAMLFLAFFLEYIQKHKGE